MKKTTGMDRSITAKWRPATQAVRGGTWRSEHGETSEALFLTSGYTYDDAQTVADRFAGEAAGMTYSRLQNPTVAMLEERIALMEGAEACRAQASGMAAMTAALLCQLSAGDHVVGARAAFGSCRWLLDHLLPRFGIETTKVHPRDLEGFRKAIRPDTRLLFGETIGNPGLEVMDISAMAEIAHEAGVPLMVDSTFATPHLCRPIDHGADLIVHSATKWLGGHGVALGGVIVDGGTFDWEASGKFPTLTEPYAGYHGLDFAEEYGPQAFLMRARAEGLRDFGACMSPANAFHILQGVETLPLRMDRHVANARAVVEFLRGAEEVEWVAYPEAEDHPDKAIADRLLPKGAGSMIAFGIKGGREAGRVFIERLRLWSHLANVGDAKSLVLHPASTTHQQLDAETMKTSGLTEDLVRLSVGLEDPNDLIDDLKQALRSAARITRVSVVASVGAD